MTAASNATGDFQITKPPPTRLTADATRALSARPYFGGSDWVQDVPFQWNISEFIVDTSVS